MAAGLGGGSSDAAGTLLALNELAGKPLADSRLHRLASLLGADVPFFLAREPAVGRGTGTQLSAVTLLPYWYLLVNPGVPLSTRWVYENLDLAALPGPPAAEAWDPEHPETWVRNDLGTVAVKRFPELAQLLAGLKEAGAWCQGVSGSGPTLFGLFHTREAAHQAGLDLAPDFPGLADRGPGPHRPGIRDDLGARRMDDLKVFTGNANRPLAEKICQYLGIPLGDAAVGRFSDGEISVEFRENVRGKDVYVIQPTSIPCNEHLLELCIMLDALKRASARCVTAVVTYYAYARQDRKTAPRTPISAKLVADLITTAGRQPDDHHGPAYRADSGIFQYSGGPSVRRPGDPGVYPGKFHRRRGGGVA